MNPCFSSNAIKNEKVFRFITYTLVFLMMVCMVMTVGSLIHNALPNWNSSLIAGVMLVIVIDRIFTYPRFKLLITFSSEWALVLGAQWVVIVLFIRILLSYARGSDSFIADLSLLARGYLANLLTLEFVIAVLLAFLAWYLSGQFLDLLDEIGLDQTQALREAPGVIPGNIIPVHQRLVNLIFSIGTVLVILTALIRVNLRAIFSSLGGIPDVELNSLSGGEAGVLLYFIFGLGLLSLSRLIALQTRWHQQRIPVSSGDLPKHWGVYSLLFLLLLILVVSVLPSNDSLGLFSVVGTLLGFLFGVLFFILQLLIILVALLLSLPLLLFGKSPPFINRLPSLPLLPTAPAEPILPPSSNAIWILIRSILLWGSLILIIVFSITLFVRQRRDIFAALRRSRVTNWLKLAWQWLYRNAHKARENLSRAIVDGWQNIVSRLEAKRSLPRPNWISLRALDPRRQVYFFYLAMIRRGTEQGLERKPSQSPSEYAMTLENSLPSVDKDIHSVTDEFIQARYSRRIVTPKEVNLVKAAWGHIRSALRMREKRNNRQ